jgi:CheY-like chemotaxis protein
MVVGRSDRAAWPRGTFIDTSPRAAYAGLSMGARVLVVDDDPWILRMVTATLEKRSYVVDTAREGRQALERALANPPDVIISDVMMPVMEGWTFVQRLRQDPRLSSIPVIFLTALGKDEARLAELGLGHEDFLAKPFRFDDLEKRVSRALTRTGSAPAQVPSGAISGRPQAPSGQRGAGVRAAGVPTPAYLTPPPGSQGTPPPIGDGRPGAYPGYSPGSAVPYGQPGYPAYPYAGYPAYPGYGPQPSPPGYPYPGEGPISAETPQPGPHGPGAWPPAEAQRGGPAPLQPPPTTAEVKRHGSGSFPAQRRTTALNGRLEQLGLSSLLVMMEMERKDGVLSLRQTESADVGRIFMRGGQVVCARLDEQPQLGGRECVYAMLRWKHGTFSFNAMEVDMEDTVRSSTTHLLMEGARLIDEANREG